MLKARILVQNFGTFAKIPVWCHQHVMTCQHHWLDSSSEITKSGSNPADAKALGSNDRDKNEYFYVKNDYYYSELREICENIDLCHQHVMTCQYHWLDSKLRNNKIGFESSRSHNFRPQGVMCSLVSMLEWGLRRKCDTWLCLWTAKPIATLSGFFLDYFSPRGSFEILAIHDIKMPGPLRHAHRSNSPFTEGKINFMPFPSLHQSSQTVYEQSNVAQLSAQPSFKRKFLWSLRTLRWKRTASARIWTRLFLARN